MSVERLILKGINGIALGETFYINYGEAITIGRGKECEISYRHFKKYPPPPWRDKHKDLLAVSRKHLRISFYNSHSIELKDLSVNGTFINGKPIIKKLFITDIAETKTHYEIRLGPSETFILMAESL
ncbi:MAG: FHA domain-containing protein [Planctomycetota bacterium]|nr:FHA domain-containing protein [Planctomycetota bacterium]MDI6787526.1 FHA domain-containing protein [Planctomycetota bacterium]